ncbi:Hypothetical predicted protein [Podarcis lilfordi]|uniref:Uncharacterized protein n=1 Tax=Podarcis lilfordi TaxID=74358 RepID=A0AA35K9D7_9SAUR|nr:Hypothetical predicted protein [Podarcis lilfordi]
MRLPPPAAAAAGPGWPMKRDAPAEPLSWCNSLRLNTTAVPPPRLLHSGKELLQWKSRTGAHALPSAAGAPHRGIAARSDSATSANSRRQPDLNLVLVRAVLLSRRPPRIEVIDFQPQRGILNHVLANGLLPSLRDMAMDSVDWWILGGGGGDRWRMT